MIHLQMCDKEESREALVPVLLYRLPKIAAATSQLLLIAGIL